MKWIKIIIISLLLMSCGTTKTIHDYENHETTKTEYIHLRDSVYLKDSIFVNQYQKGDTVFITKDKYKYLYKLKSDTILMTDTLRIVEYKDKIVEKTKKDIGFTLKYCLYWTIFLFVIFLLYNVKKGL